MPDAYDHISLICRLKATQTRNKELESGERYVKLKELHQKECRAYEHKIQALQTEVADAHKEMMHWIRQKNSALSSTKQLLSWKKNRERT